MSVLQDPALDRLLSGLHARSDEQTAALDDFTLRRRQSSVSDEEIKSFRSDKYVALDRDKAEFCYQLCRAIGARRVVEAGTSFGVSTLYLAAAVRDNARSSGGKGSVIGTEYEPEKANVARAHFAQAGLTDFIELREGDLRETLKDLRGPVDFALIDIWIPMARPALELIYPRLKDGAIVICDNTAEHRADYADYLSFIHSPEKGFRTRPCPSGAAWNSPFTAGIGRDMDEVLDPSLIVGLEHYGSSCACHRARWRDGAPSGEKARCERRSSGS